MFLRPRAGRPPARAFMPTPTQAVALITTLVGAVGCGTNSPVYFPGEVILESDGSEVEVRSTLPLRFRAPTAAEQTELDTLSATLGYTVPWLRGDRVHLEVKYTVTNLSTDSEGTFSVFADGASEFTRFDYEAVAAAFAADNEEPPPVGLMQNVKAPLLRPGEVYQGMFREDDFREASADLDGMGRFMAPFLTVLFNRSEVNPAGLEMVPSNLSPPRQWILPAMWELTIRFRATQPMTCQFMVRVRDDAHQLWQAQGDQGAGEFAPAPATFAPVLP